MFRCCQTSGGLKFYQKITDIYATSIDYDVTAAATKRFFAATDREILQDAAKVAAEIASQYLVAVPQKREKEEAPGPRELLLALTMPIQWCVVMVCQR